MQVSFSQHLLLVTKDTVCGTGSLWALATRQARQVLDSVKKMSPSLVATLLWTGHLNVKWAAKNFCDRFLACAGNLFLQVGEYKKKRSSSSGAEWEEMAVGAATLASCPQLNCVKNRAEDLLFWCRFSEGIQLKASFQNTKPGFCTTGNQVPPPPYLLPAIWGAFLSQRVFPTSMARRIKHGVEKSRGTSRPA